MTFVLSLVQDFILRNY